MNIFSSLGLLFICTNRMCY